MEGGSAFPPFWSSLRPSHASGQDLTPLSGQTLGESCPGEVWLGLGLKGAQMTELKRRLGV